jgi:hypothetical protein
MLYALELLVATGRLGYTKLQLPCAVQALPLPQHAFEAVCLRATSEQGALLLWPLLSLADREAKARTLHSATTRKLERLGDRRHLEAGDVSDLDNDVDGQVVLEVVRQVVLDVVRQAQPLVARVCEWDRTEARLLRRSDGSAWLPLSEQELAAAECRCPWPTGGNGQTVSAAVRRVLLSRLLPLLQDLLDAAAAPHGLTSSPETFAAFERTQDYAYYRGGDAASTTRKRPDGAAWGGLVYALGNGSKHFKLLSQLSKDDVSRRVSGTFQRMRTRVLVELPPMRLAPWSFEDLLLDGADAGRGAAAAAADASRRLLRWLNANGLVRRRYVQPAHRASPPRAFATRGDSLLRSSLTRFSRPRQPPPPRGRPCTDTPYAWRPFSWTRRFSAPVSASTVRGRWI